MENKSLQIPYGVADFKRLITEGYYYVDKTLLVKDVLDNGSQVTLYARPRRFGKSMNLSMLDCFFNIDGRGNRVAASVSGPKKVVYVIGRNKIVEGGIDAAIARIKAKACPPNCVRLGKKTPCAVTGKCADCDSPDRICKVTAIFDRRPTGTPTAVYVVDADLGY